MKLVIGNTLTIYLNNLYIKNEKITREYIDKIIKKTRKKYNLNLEGYLKITVHKDKNYGIIIEIKRENIDYLDCFNIEIESDIEIKEETFLYKVEDILNVKEKIYNYQNEFYLEIKDEKKLTKLIENTKIIYGKEIEKIKKNSKIIYPEVRTCTQSH